VAAGVPNATRQAERRPRPPVRLVVAGGNTTSRPHTMSRANRRAGEAIQGLVPNTPGGAIASTSTAATLSFTPVEILTCLGKNALVVAVGRHMVPVPAGGAGGRFGVGMGIMEIPHMPTLSPIMPVDKVTGTGLAADWWAPTPRHAQSFQSLRCQRWP